MPEISSKEPRKAVRFEIPESESGSLRGAATQSSNSSENDTPFQTLDSFELSNGQGPKDIVCDYDKNVTTLYKLLETSDWDAILTRLQTDPIEARTWVVRYQRNSERVRWRLLPLHAAVIFASPCFVVSALLEKYPAAASSTDDQGMLALHLAFRHHKDDESLIEELLDRFPEGVKVKDYKGRVPLDHGVRKNGMYSAKLMRQYSAAACTAGSMVVTESEQAVKSTEPAKVDPTELGNVNPEAYVVSVEKSAKGEGIEVLQDFYEERMQTMAAHTLKSLENFQQEAEEANRGLRDQYHHDMQKLRALISEEKTRDAELANNVKKETAILRAALERSQTQKEILDGLYNGTRECNDDLTSKIQQLVQDQQSLQKLLSTQQEELRAAQAMRSQTLNTLLLQEVEDADRERERHEILCLAEGICERLKRLSTNSPPENQEPGCNENLEVPTSDPDGSSKTSELS